MSSAVMDLYANRGLRIVRGHKATLETADGRRYLDLATGYGVAIFGHAHPVVTRCLTEQLGSLVSLHGSFGHDLRTRASARLARRVAVPDAVIAWSNSGTEAVEVAMKCAVMATGRRRFVACLGGYHGKTLGALSATDTAKYRRPFEPLPFEVAHVPYGDTAAMRDALDERTAAVIIEPIQGEGGVHVPPPGYLQHVREGATSCGALMMVDEVQTGCGRTGRFLAVDHDGVEADLVCLGKGLAGGIPVGVTAIRRDVADRMPRGVHTSTFGGNPLACAGVLATLDLVTDACMQANADLGTRFMQALAQTGYVPRGRGLMIGLPVPGFRDGVLKGLQRRGILAIPAGQDVVRFLPPYVVTADELDHAARLVAFELEALAAAPANQT